MSRYALLLVVGSSFGMATSVVGLDCSGGEPTPERRFVAARPRLQEPPEPGPLRAWVADETAREMAGVTDPQEQRRIRNRIRREEQRRRNEAWNEGHMTRAYEVAQLVAKLRFEVARTTGEPPAPAFPFEITLRENAAESIAGVDAYRGPMREAAAYCHPMEGAAGRLGELAGECLRQTSTY